MFYFMAMGELSDFVGYCDRIINDYGYFLASPERFYF